MAGGEGTRLRPLTSNQPKPMLPVANRPMMEHIIRLLREHGFEDIVVTVAFLANNIRSYFGDGSEFGVRLSYAAEESPLGTAGSVGNARDQLDGPFLAISGDVLTDIDLSAVVRFHEQHKAMATIGLKSMDNPLEFGIVITRPDGSIDRFLEKPNWGQVFSDTINTGIYVLEPEIFDFIAPDQSVDFSSEVFPALLEADKALFGYVCEGYWEDVGTLDAYIQAHQDCLDGKVEVDVGGFQLRRGVWLGEGCEVDPSARIEGPAVIGDYCDIGPGAHIGAHSVLGANVRIAEDVVVERAIVHDHSYLGPSVRLRGCVVGRTCDLRRAARCDEGVVVADDCLIGEHAVINAGVKIYPSKTVESGAIVNSSIVWESRGARSLFGRVGVSGLANVDMTPELAVKVAMSFGTTLKKGTTVTTSRDSSRAARVLKRAIMVGLNASGINVDDLEVATVPVTRFEVARGSSRGGITVRLRADDPESVVVRFFDDNGIDLDESAQRKIERLFFREDFRRALASEIGDIGFPPRALEHYTAALMASVDLSAIRAGGFKLVVDYAYGTASFVMPNVLAKLGADVMAVNPFASTPGAMNYDPANHARRVGDLVRASGAHMGVVLDPDSEHLILVDDSGHVLSGDEALLVVLSLAVASRPAAKMAVPVGASRAAEKICLDSGSELLWAKMSASGLMEVAREPGVAFAGDRNGGFIFPEFLPALDAAGAVVAILAMLAGTGVRLSKVLSNTPRVHMAHLSVPTPWDQKGLVMRTLVETPYDADLVLVDGVKIPDADGWTLVLPDPEDPLTHVWAEASSGGEAQAKAQELGDRIRRMLA